MEASQERGEKNRALLLNWHRINIGDLKKKLLGIVVVWVAVPTGSRLKVQYSMWGATGKTPWILAGGVLWEVLMSLGIVGLLPLSLSLFSLTHGASSQILGRGSLPQYRLRTVGLVGRS